MVYQGTGTAAGLALAPAFCLAQPGSDSAAASKRSFWDVRAQLKQDYDQSISSLRQAGRKDEADILLCHREMLCDVLLEETVKQGLSQGLDTAQAVKEACELLCHMLSQSPSPYISQRAEDLRDVCGRILTLLRQESLPTLAEIQQNVVLVAWELSPADLATADPRYIQGIVTAGNTGTSHIAILAGSLGIPTIVGCPQGVQAVHTGDLVFVDGYHGKMESDLSPKRAKQLFLMVEEDRRQAKISLSVSHLPAVTKDGMSVSVQSSISDLRSAEKSMELGADGVGLLRTEFLFLNRDSLPDEKEQESYYSAIARKLGGQPFTIRTLDIGGDKPSPCIPVSKEENPFLGVRGIRLSLQNPEIFLCQLRAILRASAHANIQVMYPMITSLEELLEAKQQMVAAKNQLAQQGIPFNPHIPEGIMVEVPSAALIADLLAPHCDFFSIGSNDLAQYVLAADRTGNCLPQYGGYFHPSVLRLIAWVLDSAQKTGTPCSLCGEMAKDPLAVPLLLGMGLSHFVVTPMAVPALKKQISELDNSLCQKMVSSVLSCSTAESVLKALDFMG